jgi:hypothetical protein
MHEVAAIVENQITIPCDHPYIHELSEASANSYKKRYGSNFERQYNTFHSLITRLKEQFAPTPLQRKTIITLADYIISLAIDLQGFAKNVLRFPEPIPDASLREDIMRTGIPYLDRPNPTLKKMPSIGVGFIDGVTVYDIGELLNHIKSTIFSAKFKRKRQMPENYIDQLLYIAKLVPELKLWLQSIDAYHWLKRRFLNAIADHQLHLEAQGFLLPITEVWQSDLSAFASIIDRCIDRFPS